MKVIDQTTDEKKVPEIRYFCAKLSSMPDASAKALYAFANAMNINQVNGVIIESDKFPDLASLAHGVMVHDAEMRAYCQSVKIPLRVLDAALEQATLGMLPVQLPPPIVPRKYGQKNEPCPFCGGECDEEGWMDGAGGRGPECEDCGATARSLAEWNRRTAPVEPTPLHSVPDVDPSPLS